MVNQKKLQKNYSLNPDNAVGICGFITGINMPQEGGGVRISLVMEDSKTSYLLVSPGLTVTSGCNEDFSTGGPMGTYGLTALLDKAIREKSEVEIKAFKKGEHYFFTQIKFDSGQEYIFWREE